MSFSKKSLALTLALALILSLLAIPSFSLGENAGTVYISREFKNDSGSSVTSVSANETFWVYIYFANNPTDTNTITACDLYYYLDSSKFEFTNGVAADFSMIQAPGKVGTDYFLVTGADTKGLYVSEGSGPSKTDVLKSSGVLAYAKIKAKVDVTAEDLATISLVNTAYDSVGTLKETFANNASGLRHVIVEAPALDVTPISDVKVYNSATVTAGAVLTSAQYITEDGTPVTLDLEDVEIVTPSDFSTTSGSVTLKAKYTTDAGVFMCDFGVTVLDDTLQYISVSGQTENPVALSNYDTTGMTVTAHYASGATKSVTGYTVSPSGVLYVGNQTIEVSYEDKTTSFAITVSPKEITPEFTLPGTYYYTGEQICPTDYTVSPSGLVKDTDYTVSYGDNVNVVTNAGSVTFSPVAGSNYTFAAVTVDFNILATKGAVTITKDLNKTYDGTAVEINNTNVSETGVESIESGKVQFAFYKGEELLGSAPKDAGTYKLVVTVGAIGNYAEATATTTFAISPAPLTVSAINANIVYGEDATSGGVNYEGFVNDETQTTTNIASSITYTYTTAGGTSYSVGSDVGTYNIVPACSATNLNYKLNFVNGTLTVSPKTVTVTGIAAENKEYDGTTSASISMGAVSIEGVVNSDNLTVTADAEFENANVGEGKNVNISNISLGGTKASNYTLSGGNSATATANITKKTITVSTVSIEEKTFDGTTSASISSITLVGYISGETVTASAVAEFVSSSAATSVSVNVSGYTLGGPDAGNYELSSNYPSGITGKIKKAGGKTLTGITDFVLLASDLEQSKDKVYEIDLSSSISGITGDEGTVTYSAVLPEGFTSASGNDLSTGGHTLKFKAASKAALETAVLTVTAVMTNYEDSTATIGMIYKTKTDVSGQLALNSDEVTYGGEISPSGICTGGDPTGTYKYEYKVEGADDSTYSSTVPTAAGAYVIKFTYEDNVENAGVPGHFGTITATLTINRKSVIVKGIEAKNKDYDGTTDVELIGGIVYADVLCTEVVDDGVTASAIGEFVSSDAALSVVVNITEITLGGVNAANYELEPVFEGHPHQTTASATILQKEVTVGAVVVKDKEYDATTQAIVSSYAIGGLIDADKNDESRVNAVFTASFTDANASTNDKIVNLGTPTLQGSNAKNYKIKESGNQTTAAAMINAKDVTVDGIEFEGKTFDGTTVATFSAVTAPSIHDVIDGDTVTAAAVGAFKSSGAATSVEIDITDIVLGGTAAGNYKVDKENSQTTASAIISKATANITTKGGVLSLRSGKAQPTAKEYPFAIGDIINGVPSNAGTVTYTASTVAATSISAVSIEGNTLKVTVTSAPAADTQDSVTVTVHSDNYEDVEVTISFKYVDKAAATVTLPAMTITYGSVYAPNPTCSVQNGINAKWTYTFTSGGATLGSTPKAVGTYGVNLEYEDDDNYGTTTSSLTIKQKPLTVTWSNTEKTYDGTGQTCSAITSGIETGDTVNVTVTYKNAGGDIGSVVTNAGVYTASAVIDNANYTIANGEHKFEIKKATPTTAQLVSTLPAASVYNGQATSASIAANTGVDGLGTITVKYTTNSGATLTKAFTAAPKDAGTYYVWADIAAGSNYTAASIQVGNFVIEKATPTADDLTSTMPAATFNGQTTKASVAAKTSVDGLGIITVKYTTNSGTTTLTNALSSDPVNAGTYYVWADIAAGKNYTAASIYVDSFTISKAVLTNVSAPAVEKLKSDTASEGKELNYTYDLSSIIKGMPNDAGTVTYSAAKVDSTSIASVSVENTTKLAVKVTSAPAADTQDSVTVTVHSDNYEDVVVTINFQYVNKTDVSNQITLADKTMTYGGTYEPQAKLDGQTKDGFTYTYATSGTSVYAAPQPTNVGEYIVKATYEDADSYGEKTANFIITQKAITVTVAVNSKTYDRTTTASIKNATVTGILDGDKSNVTVVSEAAFNTASAGDNKQATIKLSLDGSAKDNYKLSRNTVTAAAMIERKTVTVSNIGFENKVYDGTKVATRTSAEPTIDGVIISDVVTAVAFGEFRSADATTAAIVDIKIITLGGVDGSNYVCSIEGSQAIADGLVISKAALKTEQKLVATGFALTSDVEKSYEIDLSNTNVLSAMPADAYDITYAALAAYDGHIRIAEMKEDGHTLVITTKATSTGAMAGVQITVSSRNYKDQKAIMKFTFEDENFVWKRGEGGPDTPVNPVEPVTPVTPTKPAFVNPFKDVFETDFFYDAIEWSVTNNYVSGVTEDTFVPNKVCTRAELVTLLYNVLGQPNVSGVKNVFTDVDPNAYYFKAVLWAQSAGVVAGTSATTFNPDGLCSRGELVTLLWKYAGKSNVAVDFPFTDVNKNEFYAVPVAWGYKNGYVGGTSLTTFEPGLYIRRSEIVKLFFNYFGK